MTIAQESAQRSARARGFEKKAEGVYQSPFAHTSVARPSFAAQSPAGHRDRLGVSNRHSQHGISSLGHLSLNSLDLLQTLTHNRHGVSSHNLHGTSSQNLRKINRRHLTRRKESALKVSVIERSRGHLLTFFPCHT